jgi:large subunit ribosomal protein L19
MNQLQKLEQTFLKDNVPQLKIGQTVKVYLKIVEGEKERIQVFEGIVIGMQGTGHRQTFTVRKISYSVGVERIFPLHSPSIQKVEVMREGDVSRAKLYYLRERSGRAARLSEKKREVVSAKKGATVVPVIGIPTDAENLVSAESA